MNIRSFNGISGFDSRIVSDDDSEMIHHADDVEVLVELGPVSAWSSRESFTCNVCLNAISMPWVKCSLPFKTHDLFHDDIEGFRILL